MRVQSLHRIRLTVRTETQMSHMSDVYGIEAVLAAEDHEEDVQRKLAAIDEARGLLVAAERKLRSCEHSFGEQSAESDLFDAIATLTEVA